MHPHDLPEDHLPWSLESEASLLGGLLLDNRSFDLVSDILRPEHFASDMHRAVFAELTRQFSAGHAADVVTVFEGLAGAASLQELNALAQYVPSGNNARRYAEIIVERALQRALAQAADEVKVLAAAPGLSAADRLDQAQAKLQTVQLARARKAPVRAAEMTGPLLTRLQALADGSQTPGIPTGIAGIDRRLAGGLRPGKQMVLAGRPSLGKSSLALQICLNLARAGHGAAFFSMEMPNEEQMERATANVGRVLLDGITTGRMHSDDWRATTEALDVLRGLPLFFEDEPALSLLDITAKARALVRQHGIKLLVLDYIQLCGGGRGQDKRHHQIEEISRGLKTLAKQLDITILTLSQLSRSVESRVSGKPQLSDLKESGAIEEDADVVMLLSLDHVPEHGPKIIDLDFAKNRQGRVGSVPLAFDGGYQQWADSDVPLGRGRPAKKASYSEDF